jgi:hypothetical protein
MRDHLTTDEIAAAVAGLEVDDAVKEHLAECVACRSEVGDTESLFAARRAAVLADEPDWEAQAARIMDRLPVEPPASGRRSTRWLRPVLAVAAAVVVAVGLGVLRPDGPGDVPRDDLPLEEILAEMDELLADDSIPGFEIIDPRTDELDSFFDNGAS